MDTHAWLPKRALTPLQLERLRAALTVTPRIPKDFQDDKDATPVELFMEREDAFGLPRGYYQRHFVPDRHRTVRSTTRGAPLPSPLTFQGELYPKQAEALKVVLEKTQDPNFLGGLLEAAPAFGKCLGLGTPVLLHDGRTVRVEDVRAGDVLLGSDSTPRRVLSTTRGVGPLYRIVPVKGASWVCNDAHILTLVHTETDAVVDVSLQEWLRWGAWKKSRYKQFTPPRGVAFSPPSVPLPLDPYFLGVWFGDGDKTLSESGVLTEVAVSKPDIEIQRACEAVAEAFGVRVRTDFGTGGCPTYHLARPAGRGAGGNPLLTTLRDVVGRAEHLPFSYLTAAREDRAAFLAGLLDSDGYYAASADVFEIIQKRRAYADGIAFLARSLGLLATIGSKIVKGQTYWRVHVSGELTQLPLRIPRKTPRGAKHRKCVTRCGFRVEALGVGAYAGFTLDGDGRFLLGDFTVTHNTVTLCAIVAALKVPTLVLVHKQFLMDQWSERIAQFLPGAKVGRVQGPQCEFEGVHIAVGMIQSFRERTYCNNFYKTFGLVVADECHRVGAPTWGPIPRRFPAEWFLGLSGTMRRADGAEAVFKDTFGDVLFSHKESYLKPKLHFVNSRFKLSENINPRLVKRPFLINWLAKNTTRNDLLVRTLADAVQRGRKILLVSERLEHLDVLTEGLRKRLPTHPFTVGHFVGGRKPAELKAAAQAQVVAATLQLVLEGLDIPELDVLVMATPFSDPEQAVGRILRLHPGKKEPVVVDVRDDGVPRLRAMGEYRDRFYLDLGWLQAPPGA